MRIAQLGVWSWDEKMLTLEHSQDWIAEDSATAWNVRTRDVDNDEVTEIITVGCIYLDSTCDPDMRIWSITRGSASHPYPPLVMLGAVAVIGLANTFLFIRKRRQQL